MKKEYILSSPSAIEKDFMYVFSPNSKSFVPFTFENGQAVNRYDESLKDYEYISIVSKKKYSDGVTLRTKCSFDSFGAPLIVLSDDISEDENGRNMYGLHFEVVAYEKGCNVWHIVPFPERTERPIKSTKIAFSTFSIPEKSEIDLSVTVKDGKLYIDVNGEKLVAESPDLPKEFHIGITACEGINRFSSITIEKQL